MNAACGCFGGCKVICKEELVEEGFELVVKKEGRRVQ